MGKQYDLPMAGLVSNDGKFISTTEFFAGKGVFEANPLVVEKLQEVGNLLKVEKIKHSYPHCWRHKTPIIFRATPQWFIGMEHRSTPTSIRRNQTSSLDSRLGSSTYRENG